VPELFYH